MPTLRDHVKEALRAGEPDAPEAKRDLDLILARSRRKPRMRALVVLATTPVAAAAVVASVLVLRHPPGEPQRKPSARASGVHVYVRASNEPEASAIRLDLELEGEL